MISIGSNDYLNNYLYTTNSTRRNYSPLEFAELLISNLRFQFQVLHFHLTYLNTLTTKLNKWQIYMCVQRLYRLGARKVVMFEIGPIGCIPSSTKQFSHNGLCAEDINQLAVIFNNQLASMLQNLTSSLEGSYFVLGHAYWLGYKAIINPSKYGT